MDSIQITIQHFLSLSGVRAALGTNLQRCGKLMVRDTGAGERQILHRQESHLRHSRVVQELLVWRDLRAVAIMDVTTAHQQLEPTKAPARNPGIPWSEAHPMVDH